jgi:hypothetical protein|tara:strand:- start:236 stop:658 length:423 start_codon:yes stop_codon:yes gene_type:complete
MVYTEVKQRHTVYTGAHQDANQPVTPESTDATAKEKMEKGLKELKDTRAPREIKELKDLKDTHGTIVQEAGEHTQTETKRLKAEATGTTETEPTKEVEEALVTHKNDTNNKGNLKRVHLLTYQRKRWSAKSANGQGDHGT